MDALLAEIRSCTACQGLPLGPRPILQAGARARILIAGQAPGRITHAKGIPFDDPSGNRLRDWLGVARATFYNPDCFAIIPMGFCFPGTGSGGDLPPRPECAPLWRAPLMALLSNIEMTLLLGTYANEWHLGPARGERLADRVALWRETFPRLVPLPHPSPRNIAWFRRNPWFEAELLPALRVRIAEILHAPAGSGGDGPKPA
ncbi:MAG: uracil-DNA glycosylase family protein [Hyphomicrobiales bacterium]|uniref:uracil-DNA glycosylase family protein n=1 Tax=Rhabdaerophilum calidifontis TaxID=2604328 RepID=UPI001238A31E|nr:uracil-DNA glycosylase family protein [Rhabdaerophilum calidifontis]MCA1951684.1 uracil-DNA glycosylase family protein [Hyphomicrobiales bacterium]MCA1998535.1 uracil-DNA glycosylase family protein [Hyphomicrobiales bacterium]